MLSPILFRTLTGTLPVLDGELLEVTLMGGSDSAEGAGPVPHMIGDLAGAVEPGWLQWFAGTVVQLSRTGTRT